MNSTCSPGLLKGLNEIVNERTKSYLIYAINSLRGYILCKLQALLVPPGVQPVKQVSALKRLINKKNTFAHNKGVENWNTTARFEKSSVWCGVLVETTQAAS